MILIKVGKSTGCKKVSIFGSMISPDFFFFLVLKRIGSWLQSHFFNSGKDSPMINRISSSTTTTLITIRKTAQSKVNCTLTATVISFKKDFQHSLGVLSEFCLKPDWLP